MKIRHILLSTVYCLLSTVYAQNLASDPKSQISAQQIEAKKKALEGKRHDLDTNCGTGTCGPDEARQKEIQREIDILEDDIRQLEAQLKAPEASAKIDPPVTQDQIDIIQRDIEAKKKALEGKRHDLDTRYCGTGTCGPDDEARQKEIQREIDIIEDDVRQLEKKQADLKTKKEEQDQAIKPKTDEPEYMSKKIKQQSFTECLGVGNTKLIFDVDLPSQEIRLGRICAPKSGEVRKSRPDEPNDRLCSQYVQCHDGTLRYTVCACSITEEPYGDNNKNLDGIVRKCVSDGIGTVKVGDDANAPWMKKNYEYFIKKSTGTQK